LAKQLIDDNIPEGNMKLVIESLRNTPNEKRKKEREG